MVGLAAVTDQSPAGPELLTVRRKSVSVGTGGRSGRVKLAARDAVRPAATRPQDAEGPLRAHTLPIGERHPEQRRRLDQRRGRERPDVDDLEAEVLAELAHDGLRAHVVAAHRRDGAVVEPPEVAHHPGADGVERLDDLRATRGAGHQLRLRIRAMDRRSGIRRRPRSWRR